MKMFALAAAVVAWAAGSVFCTAQNGTNQPISLDECVQRALEKNLDLRIARYLPLYSQIDIDSAKADWDPKFTSNVRENFAKGEGRLVPGEFNARGSESTSERIDFGLSGSTPIGLSYNALGQLDKAEGFEFAGGTNGPTTTSYAPNVGIGMSQPLLKNFWIDRTRYTIAIEKRNLKNSEQSVRSTVMALITDVTIAYYDVISSLENVRVQEKALETAERKLAEEMKRVEVGASAPLDQEKQKAEVARIQSDLHSARRNASAAQNALKSLITDDFAALADVAVQPAESLKATPTPFNRQDSWHKGMTLRPDVLQSLTELEKQKITLKFTRNQLFPQLDVTGSYGYTGLDTRFSPSLGDISDQRNPRYGYGLVFSIPMSNRAARNSHKQAKLRQEELLLRHKSLEQRVLLTIDNAIRDAETALQQVESTRQSRIYAKAAFDAEQKKYENGKSTSFNVLQFQRDLTAAESAEIGALADYNKSLARLAQAEGYTLDQRSIRLEFR